MVDKLRSKKFATAVETLTSKQEALKKLVKCKNNSRTAVRDAFKDVLQQLLVLLESDVRTILLATVACFSHQVRFNI